MSTWIFFVQLAATWTMVGVIWFVQVVHYPLFGGVGVEGYSAYQKAHMNLTSLVVIPPMLAELGSSVWLCWQRPLWLPTWGAWVGLSLVIALWAVTFFLQVPQHGALLQRFDPEIHRSLVRGNFVRSILWTVRGGLVLWMLHLLVQHR